MRILYEESPHAKVRMRQDGCRQPEFGHPDTADRARMENRASRAQLRRHPCLAVRRTGAEGMLKVGSDVEARGLLPKKQGTTRLPHTCLATLALAQPNRCSYVHSLRKVHWMLTHERGPLRPRSVAAGGPRRRARYRPIATAAVREEA